MMSSEKLNNLWENINGNDYEVNLSVWEKIKA